MLWTIFLTGLNNFVPGTLISEAGGWYSTNFTINSTRIVYEAGNSVTFAEFKCFRYEETAIHPLEVVQISRFPSNSSFSMTLRVRSLRSNNIKRISVSVFFLKPRSANPNIAFFSKGTYYGNFYSGSNIVPNFGVPVNMFGSPAT